EPLLVELDVLADGGRGPEEIVLCGGPQDADGCGGITVGGVEEAAFGDVKIGDGEIARLDAEDAGNILLGFGNNFGGDKALAGSAGIDLGDVFADELIVTERKTWRGAADFLQGLPIGGFLGFNDEIV